MTTTDPAMETFETRVAELEEIADRLGPIVSWLISLVHIRDNAIILRLRRLDEPYAIADQTASTTSSGYDNGVFPGLVQVEANDFYGAPFAAVAKIDDLIEQFRRAGLSWRVDETTS